MAKSKIPKGYKPQRDENKVDGVTPNGRPAIYNEEFADLICHRIATHALSYKKLCEKFEDMPTVETISDWRWNHKSFSEKYDTAKARQSELMIEECDDVSRELMFYRDSNGEERVDPGYIQSRKLIVDTRKWFATKLNARKYGIERDLEAAKGENDLLRKELQELREKLEKKDKQDY